MSRPIRPVAVDVSDGRRSQPLLVDIDGVTPGPSRSTPSSSWSTGCRTASRSGGRAAAAAERALRAGLGQWLGGQSELLPAQSAGLAGAAARDLRRRRSQRRRALEAGAARGVRATGGRWPGSTTTSTRAVTSGREQRAEPTLLVPTEPHLGLEEAHVEALRLGRLSTLTAWTGFWPIFFLLVVLKIPVFGAHLARLVGSQEHPSRRQRPTRTDGGFKRAAAAKARPAVPATAALTAGGAALPARRTARHRRGDTRRRQAGCAARFRSRRISRR